MLLAAHLFSSSKTCAAQSSAAWSLLGVARTNPSNDRFRASSSSSSRAAHLSRYALVIRQLKVVLVKHSAVAS